ncbi:MAG: Gfo/Idh/MocA family oxidoreductase [Candidatus Hydrogenedentes bacterium]|nr:Gfo/Idh/MocA family oxidoreductase [Candidatus Hydrogenedentota bacterium]
MPDTLNRRQFLDRAAVSVAGMTVAANAAHAQDAPSERVIVGVMGLSRGLALTSIFAAEPNVEVRYVCDADSNRVADGAAAVEKAGKAAPKGITDFRQILDDKEVDVLVCAAPNHWHAPATILGCSAGKHVYVEKPCSHTPHEAELMTEAARTHKRLVQVGTQRRSSENTRAAIAMLHAGELGRVYSSRALYASARGSIGKGKPADVPATLDYELWQGPAPRKPYMDNRVPYNWHWFWHWGNGELGNNGVHTLDICRWGLGVDFPVRVTSNGGRYCFDDDQETPDTHVVGFEFEDKKLITWQGHSCNAYNPEFVTFYGEKGTLKVLDYGDYVLYDGDGKEVRTSKGQLGEAEHIPNFLACIRENAPEKLHCGIEEAYPSTMLTHLGNIAHRTGRTLHCDPSNGHILDDAEAMSYWKREYEPGWEPKV